MNKVKIEYDGSRSKKRVEKKVKAKGSRRGYVTEAQMVPVKDPRCWEIITIENSTLYMPGQRLTKKQVDALCRGDSYEVEIGQHGQFRVTNSRY